MARKPSGKALVALVLAAASSIAFAYQVFINSYQLALTGHPLQSEDGSFMTFIGDFNGDGKQDVLRSSANPAWNAIWYGTETGFSEMQLVLTGHPLHTADGAVRSYVGDFNGDGRADVLRGYVNPAYNAIWYGTPTGFTDYQLVLTGHPLQAAGAAIATYVADFNGDGMDDVLRGYVDPAYNAIWYGTPTGFTDYQLVLTGHPLQDATGATRTYVADFDGDGKADVLRGYSDPNSNAIWYSTGSGFTDYQLVLTGHPLQLPGGAHETYIADFNGDGKADILRGYSDPIHNYIWYSKPDERGFVGPQPVLTGHPLQGDGTRSYVGDFNGDGKADVLRGYVDPTANALWFSSGTGFCELYLFHGGHPGWHPMNGIGTRSYVVDFNGNGTSDVLRGYSDPAFNILWNFGSGFNSCPH